ncbi:hypothetical protein GCM10017674_60230 [Streptomyces gardneri]|uniref:Uncharacterized protein n=1 Tax=Streptomyces gardneri TaxID=66892 RepID=A0A4Y3RHS4_9ACTN|nr:hypothetical protein SGA01_29010 [Streptomyces gardneri]GHH13218.1 hypothetical protein GCM10017674_60230 [Streptomyces gardneri]
METTGVESFEMPKDTTETTPAPDGPTVTEQVARRTEVVEHSVTTLESVRDEVLQLTEAELPGVSGLRMAFVDAAENSVVVESGTAAPALVAALGERYGIDTIAVSLTSGTGMAEPQADRQWDTSPYYGGARILSYLTTTSKTWCTAGFAWKYIGNWHMVPPGHCTTANGGIMNPQRERLRRTRRPGQLGQQFRLREAPRPELLLGRPGFTSSTGHGRHDDRRGVWVAGDRDPGNRPLRQRNHRQEHGRSQEDVRILHRQGGLRRLGVHRRRQRTGVRQGHPVRRWWRK